MPTGSLSADAIQPALELILANPSQTVLRVLENAAAGVPVSSRWMDS